MDPFPPAKKPLRKCASSCNQSQVCKNHNAPILKSVKSAKWHQTIRNRTLCDKCLHATAATGNVALFIKNYGDWPPVKTYGPNLGHRFIKDATPDIQPQQYSGSEYHNKQCT